MKKVFLILMSLIIFSATAFAEVSETSKSLVYKATATWCGPCGSWGWDLQEQIYQDNHEKAIVFHAHASSSSLGSTLTNNFMSLFESPGGYPNWIANGSNETVYSQSGGIYTGQTRSNIKDMVDDFALEDPVVNTAMTYEIKNGKLTVKTKSKFFQKANTEYYLSVLILEDGIKAQQAGQQGEVIHDHVLRSYASANPYGEAINTGPAKAGDEIKKTFTKNLDYSWNSDNVYPVLLMLKREGNSFVFANASDEIMKPDDDDDDDDKEKIKTGSFDSTFTFKGSERAFSMFVPENYDTNMNYDLMVCLHDNYKNSSEYREKIIGQMNWQNALENTIFLFPDGGNDDNKSFYEPANDEDVIEASINYIKNIYNINENNVYLQGVRYGGRYALKYGLDNYNMFSGILLCNPAIMGHLDAKNRLNNGMFYNYSNAGDLNIFTVYNSKYPNFIKSYKALNEELIKVNAYSGSNFIDNSNYDILAVYQIEEGFDFIKDPYLFNEDAELIKFEMPERTNESQIIPKVLIRNTGMNDITKLNIDYKVNGKINYFVWQGQIKPFNSSEVELDEIDLEDGLNNLVVNVNAVNSVNDPNTSNNELKFDILYEDASQTLPMVTDIKDGEFPPDRWILESSGSIYTWMNFEGVAKTGNNSIMMSNSPFYFDNRGERELLSSPKMDLTTVEKPHLLFELAHNYFNVIVEGSDEKQMFADTLIVSVSTDYGQTYNEVYRKAGSDLATANKPIEEPENPGYYYFKPSASEWRLEAVDLQNYKTENDLIVRFELSSGRGGTTYIDDIRVEHYEGSSVYEYVKSDELNVYPNPTDDIVSMRLSKEIGIIEGIEIYNSVGNIVESIDIAGTSEYNDLNVSDLSPGLYFIHVQTGSQKLVKKLIIK